MIDLRNLELEEIEQLIQKMGEPRFRAKQIFGWIYKNAAGFEDMSNVPKELRDKLAEVSHIGNLEMVKVQVSKTDGTRKYLFGLEDGNTIESVFMKYKYGNSLCVSSQAGCRMGCKFCASTIDGLARNLTAGEIIAQILYAEKDAAEDISHVVVMGTGEPFDNYDNLSKFIRIANHKDGMNLGMRNITVSTCGLVPMIAKFGEDFPQVNLAISLHGANDEVRESMMPVNKRYPLRELIKACKEYTDATHRRITFEYTLVHGVNDSQDAARQLCALLRGMLCHVNLIPLNEVRETGLTTVDRKKAVQFMRVLEEKNIPVSIRRELGGDIDGACGQLRLGSVT